MFKPTFHVVICIKFINTFNGMHCLYPCNKNEELTNLYPVIVVMALIHSCEFNYKSYSDILTKRLGTFLCTNKHISLHVYMLLRMNDMSYSEDGFYAQHPESTHLLRTLTFLAITFKAYIFSRILAHKVLWARI